MNVCTDPAETSIDNALKEVRAMQEGDYPEPQLLRLAEEHLQEARALVDEVRLGGDLPPESISGERPATPAAAAEPVPGMTGAQAKFLRDLLTDARRLFFAGKPDAKEMDFVAWMGGLLNRHLFTAEKKRYASQAELDAAIATATPYRARRLIGALVDVRDRMTAKLPREATKTPPQLLSAIWAAAKRCGHDKETVQTIVHAATNGETTSTGNLRREEAIEVLKRVGGETNVFEVKPGRDGKKASIRERK